MTKNGGLQGGNWNCRQPAMKIPVFGYPLDSGSRSGIGLVGQTIAFCRLSTPGRFPAPTGSKKNPPSAESLGVPKK